MFLSSYVFFRINIAEGWAKGTILINSVLLTLSFFAHGIFMFLNFVECLNPLCILSPIPIKLTGLLDLSFYRGKDR